MLIYAGANTSAVTRIGQYAPLHVAASSASLSVVDQLLKAGAAVDARAVPSGATALHLAATTGNAAIINRLIDAGADKNANEAEWGQSPLIFAAAFNRVEAIKALTARGANPNIASTFIDVPQRNALDRAASQRQQKALESMGVGPEKMPTASQMQAAVQASRDVFLSGKIPPPSAEDTENQGRGQNFNPEEINHDTTRRDYERRLNQRSSRGDRGAQRTRPSGLHVRLDHGGDISGALTRST